MLGCRGQMCEQRAREKLVHKLPRRFAVEVEVAACLANNFHHYSPSEQLTPGITRRVSNMITEKPTMRAALNRGRVHAVVRLRRRWNLSNLQLYPVSQYHRPLTPA